MTKNTFRNALVAVLAVILVTVPALLAVALTAKTDAVPGNQTLVSGCVIRFLPEDDGRPSIHANGAHRCAGVDSVRIDRAGQVEVIQTITDPGKNPILFAQCQADETLGGQRGIICGASGGTASTRFRLYDSRLGRTLDLRSSADRARVEGKNSNLWVGWFHTNWTGQDY